MKKLTTSLAGLLALFIMLTGGSVSAQPSGSNIALDQSVWASSHENGSVRPIYANDGDMSTRWSSLHQDDEWIVVDFVNIHSLNDVVLHWDSAYAEDYEIQVSNDANNWTTVYHETNGDGGTDSISLSGEQGQFIRLYCNSRATQYGNTLYEIEAYGEDITEDTVLTDVEVQPDSAIVAINESLDLEASGFNQYGYELSINPSWSVSGGGSIDSNGVFTPDATGTFTVSATARGVSGSTVVTVIDSLGDNIALDKPASASSLENSGYAATNANDGSLGSRWSSAFSDGEWIRIDLTEAYSLDLVRLHWESSYAEEYEIQVSDSGNTWTTIHDEDNGEGGTETIMLNGEEGRYLRVFCNSRATQYGNSLWEIQAYGEKVNPDTSVANIAVSPDTARITEGDSVDFAASGFNQNGNVVSMDPSWTASGGGTIDSNGVYTGTTPGTYTVTASAQGVSGNATVIVVDDSAITNIAVTPDTANIALTDSADFTATAYNLNGDPLPADFTWSVSGGGTIDSTGLFVPSATGTFTVTASAGGTSGTAVVIVTDQDSTLSDIEVVPDSVTVMLGDSVDFDANGLNANGNPLSVDPSWTVSGGGSIDTNGVFTATSIGTFTVTASDQGVSGTAIVIVTDSVRENIALDKSIWASSHENGDLRPTFANDGDMSTRWSSLHQDDEWIVVDFGAVYSLDEVVLNWETAYSDDYEVQVSNDAGNWTTVHHETNGQGGTESIALSGQQGQFLRIKCNSRATQWGNSLYEIEAYGDKISDDTVLTNINVTPDSSIITVNETVDLDAAGFNQYGYELSIEPSWSVSGGGTIDSNGVFTPSSAGTYTVTASAQGVSGTAVVTVIEGLGNNLALDKPANASSLENGGFPASNANDGSLGSRWSSAFSDNEWIEVDLQDNYNLDVVRLHWEAAYAEDYEIQVSDSGNTWTTIHHETNGDGGTETILLNGQEGRYLRVLCNSRATPYGNSLYEVEAYGTQASPAPAAASVSAAPVPFNNKVTLTTNDGSEIQNITVKNQNGQDVAFTAQKQNDGSAVLRLKNAASGVYFVYVQTSKGTQVLRVSKQ